MYPPPPNPKKQITFKIQDRNAHILFYFHSYDDIFGGHKKRTILYVIHTGKLGIFEVIFR